MNKRDDAVARTLREIKNQGCQHHPNDRAVDFDSGDVFCGGCGTTLTPYQPGTNGIYPGSKASDLIVAQLKDEIRNENVQTRLFWVEPVPGKPGQFDCYMQVHRKSGTEHRHYTLTRTSDNDDATIERRK